MNDKIHVVDHPLIQHKLSLMREKTQPSSAFRLLLREIASLLVYDVTRDLPLTHVEIETPLQKMQAPVIAGKKLCFVSVLRAGNGLLDGMLDLIPSASVGHIGLCRDPKTLQASEYYFKMPKNINERLVIVVDPMLATGSSIIMAIDLLKKAGAKKIKFVSLLASPEGVDAFHTAHPDVSAYTAAIDERLDDNGYILPGLGDAGDRIYDT